MGFNNWAMRVTEADTDAAMVSALGKSGILANEFTRLLQEREYFRMDVAAFTQFWPIFDVKDIRKKGLRYKFHGLERKEYVRRMLDAKVKHAPTDAFDGEKPTWSDTIRVICIVRCNLIHGEKGDASEDVGIVTGAYQTLLGFIDGAELYRRL